MLIDHPSGGTRGMDFAKAATGILEPDKKLSVIVGDTPRSRNDIIRI